MIGLPLRSGESEEAGVGGFSGGPILSDAFAEFFPRGGDIQNIVDDLKGQSEGLAKAAQVA